ncbi:hypothetical protein ATN83_4940 [Raoultella ornithinolytica]|nr:hypothetical protein ATN83_4940 [Raoultella ornithinolytica]
MPPPGDVLPAIGRPPMGFARLATITPGAMGYRGRKMERIS